MSVKSVGFEPNFCFKNIEHRYPKKECYVFSEKIKGVKNTPVKPTFLKKIINLLTSIHRKIIINKMIQNIKNKLSSTEMNRLAYKEFLACIEINIAGKAKLIERSNSEIEIKGYVSELIDLNEIKNLKEIKIINDLISHAGGKFNFYDFSNYLTEVKRAKDYFSSINKVNNKYNELVTIFNEILNLSLSNLNKSDFKNIYNIINKTYIFENIHLNDKYSFMDNFSSSKERDNFISTINLLVIAESERGIISGSNINKMREVENGLSIIMKKVLGKKAGENISFKELINEWGGEYIDKHYDFSSNEISREKEIVNSEELNKSNKEYDDKAINKNKTIIVEVEIHNSNKVPDNNSNISESEITKVNVDDVNLEFDDIFNDEILEDILSPKELFYEDESKYCSAILDDKGNEDKSNDDDVILYDDSDSEFDNLLASTKENLFEIKSYLDEKDIKTKKLLEDESVFKNEILKIINIENDVYNKIEHYDDDIKNKFNSILDSLAKIDEEERVILSDIKFNDHFYSDFDKYKNEINKNIIEIDELLNNKNTANLEEVKSTLADEAEILNNILLKIKSSKIEASKTNDLINDFDGLNSNVLKNKDINIKGSVVNNLIKELDKIIIDSKTESIDNEINKLLVEVNQGKANAKSLNKPLDYIEQNTDIINSKIDDNALNVDDLFLSLEEKINNISLDEKINDLQSFVDSINKLSSGAKDKNTYVSELSKVEKLKSKFIARNQMVNSFPISQLPNDILDGKYIKHVERLKKLKDEVTELELKFKKLKKQDDVINNDVINNDVIKSDAINSDVINSNVINKEKNSHVEKENNIKIESQRRENTVDSAISEGSAANATSGMISSDTIENNKLINVIKNIKLTDDNIISLGSYKNENIEDLKLDLVNGMVSYVLVTRKVNKEVKNDVNKKVIIKGVNNSKILEGASDRAAEEINKKNEMKSIKRFKYDFQYKKYEDEIDEIGKITRIEKINEIESKILTLIKDEKSKKGNEAYIKTFKSGIEKFKEEAKEEIGKYLMYVINMQNTQNKKKIEKMKNTESKKNITSKKNKVGL
ncbi:hypothetical protein [Proteus hauseri]|uniref:hypothetical protein n=1 Tax=Proteus hauseri TaxID=183417 RepID=UPI00100954C9|nr:hypothetical protein [Proteus hauseri]QAV23800.1 hypothetical protein PH4a_10810 [Proteus hauseri]